MPVFLLPPAAPRYGSGQASGGHSITPGIKSRKQSTRREAVLRGAYHHGGGGGSTRGVSYGLGLGDEEDDHPRQGAEASAEGGGEGEGVAVGGVEFVRQRTEKEGQEAEEKEEGGQQAKRAKGKIRIDHLGASLRLRKLKRETVAVASLALLRGTYGMPVGSVRMLLFLTNKDLYDKNYLEKTGIPVRRSTSGSRAQRRLKDIKTIFQRDDLRQCCQNEYFDAIGHMCGEKGVQAQYERKYQTTDRRRGWRCRRSCLCVLQTQERN